MPALTGEYMKLTDTQKKLAEQLLLSVINRESVIEYNELAKRITPAIFWRQVGKEIGEVSKLCKQLGLPLLSAKVVSKGKGTAGIGFYGLMKELGIDTEGKREKELFSQELKKIRECQEWYKLADYLGLDLNLPHPPENNKDQSSSEIQLININDSGENNKTASNEKEILESPPLPEELITNQGQIYTEGAKKQIIVNAYERNAVARNKCIQIHGAQCSICGFDFGAFYGPDLDGKIHIHHKKPLHLIDDTYEVDPKLDLIPVCPNCHLVLHSKQKGTYTIEEVQKMIRMRDLHSHNQGS